MFAPVMPWSIHATPSGKGTLTSFMQSGGKGDQNAKLKSPDDPISKKDVFNFLFPDGWQCTPTLDDSTDTTAVTMDSSVSELSDLDRSSCSYNRKGEGLLCFL